MCACSRPRIERTSVELHVERQAGRNPVRDRSRPWSGSRARGRSGGWPCRRSGGSCLRSRGNSADRRPGSTPVNIGERSSPARMISWVRSLVWVIQQGTCAGCSSRLPMNENTGSGESPGCASMTEKSMLRASRRGGVPVLRRPTGSAQLAQPCRERDRGRVAGPPGLVVAQPDVDQAGQESSSGQDDRGSFEAHPDLRHDAAERDPAPGRCRPPPAGKA